MDSDPATRFRENVTEIAAMVVTLVWLAGLFTGQWWWVVALLGGYLVFVPLVALLFGDESDKQEWWDDVWGEDAATEPNADETVDGETPTRPPREGTYDRKRDNRNALETLRARYAAGELTEAQFERKLERLLETETLEDAEQWTPSDRNDGDNDRNRRSSDRTGDSDRDLEFET